MSDHADVIREYVDDTELFLLRGGNTDPRVVAVRAALDALVAERDEARQDLKDEQGKSRASWRSAIQAQDRAEAAEAERDKLRRELFDYKRGEGAVVTDAEHLARSVAAAQDPPGFALWKPWALDLADGLIAAEARVTELEAALNGRVGHGHNDTCSAMLGSYECTCGQEGAVAALAAPTKEDTDE